MIKDQVATETESWVVEGLHRGAAIGAALDQNAGRRRGSDPEAVVAVEIIEELGGKNDLGESEYRVEVTYDTTFEPATDEIDASSDENSFANTNDTAEDSNTPEWRAFDSDSDSEKKRVGVPNTSSTDRPVSDDSDEDTEQQNSLKQVDWQASETYDSQKEVEQADDQHQIHSFADIEHTINCELDENSESLVFDSMERGGITEVDGVEYALENNDFHCTCGKTNLSKEEAVKHLNEVRDAS